MSCAAVEAVTFDATGTLFHSPRLGAIYSQVLGRHGVEVGADEAARRVHTVWRELDCREQMDRERFGAHPGGARGWWRRFLDRFCEYQGAAPASPFAATELFDRFARAAAWEVYPDVVPALEALAGRGLRLAVVSNWDPRLPRLLEELRLARHFDAVVHSAAVGVEKPHPEIFRRALAALELPAERVLHVGDSRRHDLEGARAVGMRALLLDRDGGGGDLPSLSELPPRVREVRPPR